MPNLVRMVPPPAKLSGRAAPACWPSVERFLGTGLPDDYKQLVETYGNGDFDEYLYLLSPGQRGLPWITAVLGGIGSLAYLRGACGPADFRDPLYPEPGGLLPWAVTSSGDGLYWRTRGSPAEWTVVVLEARGRGRDEFGGSAVDFLAAVFAREHVCPLFPDDFPSVHPTFASRGSAS